MSRFRPTCRLSLSILLALVLTTGALFAADDREVTETDLAALKWRAIGPANMGGRVSAIALVPGSRTDFYVGFATGGIFKTTNLGTTFQPVFTDEATSSIGALAVSDAPADWPGWDALAAEGDTVAIDEREAEGKGRIVWVGTGEGNGRNSSSWGNGVYRSVDGGGDFEHLGLAETHDIPMIAVDPRDPDVCYVAALGHLWGPNPERGVYRTRDGGQSWDHVLKVDDKVGACDVVIDPKRPDTVYAALYARQRTAWSFTGCSRDAGLFRSDDGGENWTKLTDGLPDSTGRIGLAIFAGDTDILYATIESDQGGTGRSAWDDRSPAGGLFRSDDRGDSWRRINELNFRPFYFSRVAVDPEDVDRVYMPGWDVAISDDGGRSFRRNGSEDVHVDHHAMVIDPADPERLYLGNDGGIYISHDRAETWDHLSHIDAGQFYHVDVDMSDPYRVAGGLQDNGSWIGPSATGFKSGSDNKAGILSSDWMAAYGGDGFRVAFDPEDPDIIYATSQGGNLSRVHLSTHLQVPLRASADEGQERLRFNWDAPFLISRHDPSVIYHAGNKVFELKQRGEFWYPISEDLSRREVDKLMTEGSDAETYGTVTALAESPLSAGVLWAGTDDGRLHVTFDNGDDGWKDVTPKQGDGLYVAHIEASQHDARRAYAVIDGHRSDVFRPILLVTGNGGGKWREIHGDLPGDSPLRVVREDPTNPDVLFCGNERSAYVSLDRGGHWLKLGGDGLPTVPVYDLVLHPREGDLVAATHGRSLWILDDVACLGALPGVVEEDLHLFRIKPAQPRLYGFRGYGNGKRPFRGANPRDGAIFTYWLKEMPEASVSVKITGPDGQTVRSLSDSARPGLNRVAWNLQPDSDRRFNNSQRGGPVFVEPGLYKVTLSAGEISTTAEFEVRPYPGWRPDEERLALPPASNGGK